MDARFLHVDAGARYWEDATVNGTEDEDGTLIPFNVDGRWKPIIDIDTGTILDWPNGTIAKIHYKVCDDGIYKITDKDGNLVMTKDGYVPDIMCPEGDGYSDYIIMNVDGEGKIANWKPTFDEFKAVL